MGKSFKDSSLEELFRLYWYYLNHKQFTEADEILIYVKENFERKD